MVKISPSLYVTGVSTKQHVAASSCKPVLSVHITGCLKEFKLKLLVTSSILYIYILKCYQILAS